MVHLKVAFALIAALNLVLITRAAESKDIGQWKLDLMRKLRDSSSDGLIELTPKEYE